MTVVTVAIAPTAVTPDKSPERSAAAAQQNCMADDSTGAELKDSILEQVTCPVCMGIVLPLYQCNSGHIICAQCQRDPRIKSCPTCREPRSSLNGRCRGLEALARPLCSACKWACNGCPEMFGADDARRSHEQHCEERSVHTLCHGIMGCDWAGPLWRHSLHLKEAHSDFVEDKTDEQIALVSDDAAQQNINTVYLHRFSTRCTANDPSRQPSLAVRIDQERRTVDMAMVGCKPKRPFVYCCETLQSGSIGTVTIGTISMVSPPSAVLEPRHILSRPQAGSVNVATAGGPATLRVSIRPIRSTTTIKVRRMQTSADQPMVVQHRCRDSQGSSDDDWSSASGSSSAETDESDETDSGESDRSDSGSDDDDY